jgi:hypothetical protein
MQVSIQDMCVRACVYMCFALTGFYGLGCCAAPLLSSNVVLALCQAQVLHHGCILTAPHPQHQAVGLRTDAPVGLVQLYACAVHLLSAVGCHAGQRIASAVCRLRQAWSDFVCAVVKDSENV